MTGCRGSRFQGLFRRPYLPFWRHTVKGDKRLRSFSLCLGHLRITGL